MTEPTLIQALALYGYGHEELTQDRLAHMYRHMIFNKRTGRVAGYMTAHEAWRWLKETVAPKLEAVVRGNLRDDLFTGYRVEVHTGRGWGLLAPSNGEPYLFEGRKEATWARDLYGHGVARVRRAQDVQKTTGGVR